MNKMMTKLAVIGIILLTYSGRVYGNPFLFGDPAIEGRWDITVDKGDKKVPSWLDVRHSGNRIRDPAGHGDRTAANPVSANRHRQGTFSLKTLNVSTQRAQRIK
jgi:hypothetical protein